MIELTGDGRLANISRIVQLTIARQGAELTLTTVLNEVETGASFTLQFRNVSDLSFRGERVALSELVLLMAEDVSSQGWEGVRFAVKDYEEEFISFRCERIERG